MESQNESVLPKNAPTYSIDVGKLISMMESDGWKLLYRNDEHTCFALCVSGISEIKLEFILGSIPTVFIRARVAINHLVAMSILIDSSATENEVYDSCKRLYNEVKSASEEILNIMERIYSIRKDIENNLKRK